MSDDLESEVGELQRDLAAVDLLIRRPGRRGKDDYLELLVARRDRLKVKMYQETGHKLPHVHIDYGREHHVASYSIDPARRLAGTLDGGYDSTVLEWITSRRPRLLEVWHAMQSGYEVSRLVADLEDDA